MESCRDELLYAQRVIAEAHDALEKVAHLFSSETKHTPVDHCLCQVGMGFRHVAQRVKWLQEAVGK